MTELVSVKSKTVSVGDSCRPSGSFPLWLRSTKQNPRFHFNRLSINAIWPELPLQQRVCDGLALLRKSADHMFVLPPAVLVNNDPYGNRIELPLGQNRIHSMRDVIPRGIVLHAYRRAVSTLACT